MHNDEVLNFLTRQMQEIKQQLSGIEYEENPNRKHIEMIEAVIGDTLRKSALMFGITSTSMYDI